MRLVELKCPKCGAILQINSELSRGLCNYCGNEFLTEEETNKIQIVNGKEFGFEQWQGAREAINVQKEELIKKLEGVIGLVANVDNLRIKYESGHNRLISLGPIKTRSKILQAGIGFVIGIIAIFLISVNGLAMSLAEIMFIWMAVWAISSCILIGRSNNLYNKEVRERENYRKHVDELKAKYDLEEEALMKKLDFIPPDYRNAAAVENIYKYLKNNRADNLTEAINLFEEEKHRERMENIQKTAVRGY